MLAVNIIHFNDWLIGVADLEIITDAENLMGTNKRYVSNYQNHFVVIFLRDLQEYTQIMSNPRPVDEVVKSL